MKIDPSIREMFFAMLKSGLWERPMAGSPELSDSQWHDLYKISLYHTVEGICYKAIELMPSTLSFPKDLFYKWAARVENIERSHLKVDTCLEQQYSRFSENGLTPILLKGKTVSECYKTPNLRVCGDIDWFFAHKEYDAVLDLLKSKGFSFNGQAGDSVEYSWQGFPVEHHRQLFDVFYPKNRKFLMSEFENVYSQPQTLMVGKMPVRQLPPLLQIVQVTLHIFKHVLSFGIGMRQLCDVARLLYVYAGQIDIAELKRVYKRLGVLKWVAHLHRILIDYVGLQARYVPFAVASNRSVDWMLEEIFRGGNFGFYDTRFGVADADQQFDRQHSFKRVFRNFLKYFPYAPKEVLSFPVVHLISRWSKDDVGRP